LWLFEKDLKEIHVNFGDVVYRFIFGQENVFVLIEIKNNGYYHKLLGMYGHIMYTPNEGHAFYSLETFEKIIFVHPVIFDDKLLFYFLPNGQIYIKNDNKLLCLERFSDQLTTFLLCIKSWKNDSKPVPVPQVKKYIINMVGEI